MLTNVGLADFGDYALVASNSLQAIETRASLDVGVFTRPGSLDSTFRPDCEPYCESFLVLAVLKNSDLVIGYGGSDLKDIELRDSQGKVKRVLMKGVYPASVLELADGKLFVASSYFDVDASSSGHLVNRVDRFLPTGEPDLGFQQISLVGNIVRAAAVPSGRIYISVLTGSAAENVTVRELRRLDPSGQLEADYLVELPGDLLAVQADEKLLVSIYDPVHSDNQILRLHTDGIVDESFQAGSFYGSVRSIFLQPDNKILLVGPFSVQGRETSAPVIRLLPTGELDPAFHIPALSQDGYPYSSALQADGKLLIGGYFTAVDGVARKNLARLNFDGSLDLLFTPNGGPRYPFPATGGYVTQLVVQGDKAIIGGSFSEVNGVPSRGLARLNLTESDLPRELTRPKLFNVRTEAGGLAFSIRTVVAWTYDVETAEQLPSPNWAKLLSFQGDGFAISSRLPVDQSRNSFYRIFVRKE